MSWAMRLPILNQGALSAGSSTPSASFSATLLSSLVPQVYTGSSTPTMTRATTAYVTDFEGLLKQVPSGCARLGGARFVRNKLLKTEDLANAAWTKANGTVTTGIADPLGGTTAFTWTATAGNAELYQQDSAQAGRSFLSSVWIRRRTGTGGILLYRDTAATVITAAVTSSWQAIATTVGSSAAATIYFDLLLLTSGDAVDVWHPMWEDVTGQSDQNPSEYVSVGVLSDPYHGAGVDGCEYFTTQNGNTVSSNVVTEATGAAISSATLLGYQAEGARTNYALWNRDLTNAAWVSGGGGIATAKTATGADGTANGATTLTASGANGTLIQSITRASAQRATGCRIKRRTGSGTVNMTQDNGGTWTAVTVTADWTAVAVPAATAANPNIGFRIVTSGDAIDVDFVMHEEAAFVSSPIPTTTVAVARNADNLTYVSASNFGEPTGSIYAEITVSAINAASINCVLGMGPTGSFPLFVGAATSVSTNDVSANLATTGSGLSFLTAPRKVAAAWGGATRSISKDGAAAVGGAYDGGMNPATNMTVGNYSIGPTYELFGTVRNVSLWATKKTDAELAALTT